MLAQVQTMCVCTFLAVVRQLNAHHGCLPYAEACFRLTWFSAAFFKCSTRLLVCLRCRHKHEVIRRASFRAHQPMETYLSTLLLLVQDMLRRPLRLSAVLHLLRLCFQALTE
ncbi:hypothetical protein BKA63DRAFT_324441 [Paraphoma chrysanthemicola]|nr:hypothetical protein BKA63DRAFT_324441 [Paraphoma chrysanthemicola]